MGTELDNLDVLAEDYDDGYEAVQLKIDEVYDRIEILEERIRKLPHWGQIPGTTNIDVGIIAGTLLVYTTPCFEALTGFGVSEWLAGAHQRCPFPYPFW